MVVFTVTFVIMVLSLVRDSERDLYLWRQR